MYLQQEEHRGYILALNDVRELLSNARENKGGIHFGELFIEGAHWSHELEDQLNMLEEVQSE